MGSPVSSVKHEAEARSEPPELSSQGPQPPGLSTLAELPASRFREAIPLFEAPRQPNIPVVMSALEGRAQARVFVDAGCVGAPGRRTPQTCLIVMPAGFAFLAGRLTPDIFAEAEPILISETRYGLCVPRELSPPLVWSGNHRVERIERIEFLDFRRNMNSLTVLAKRIPTSMTLRSLALKRTHGNPRSSHVVDLLGASDWETRAQAFRRPQDLGSEAPDALIHGTAHNGRVRRGGADLMDHLCAQVLPPQPWNVSPRWRYPANPPIATRSATSPRRTTPCHKQRTTNGPAVTAATATTRRRSGSCSSSGATRCRSSSKRL